MIILITCECDNHMFLAPRSQHKTKALRAQHDANVQARNNKEAYVHAAEGDEERLQLAWQAPMC